MGCKILLKKLQIQREFIYPGGIYIQPLNREKKWDFTPIAKVGDILFRGEAMDLFPEGRFHHLIMIPFSVFGKVEITHVSRSGAFNIDTVHCLKGIDEIRAKVLLYDGSKMAC